MSGLNIDLEGVEYKGFIIASNPWRNGKWWDANVVELGRIVKRVNARTQIQAIDMAQLYVDSLLIRLEK